jgi:prolyl-tRNA synthetase
MNPLAIRVAKIDIQRIVASLELCPGFNDDHRLKTDMLEGETGLNEIVSALLAENEDDDGLIAALDEQVDVRSIRIERAKARIEARKKAIISLLDCARETTLKLPEATLSLRTLKARPKVTDADQLPDEFVTVETLRKPNREAIDAAFERGQPIPGVTITNGGASLSIRRK